MAIIYWEVHLCLIKVRLIEEFPNKTKRLNSFTRVFQILRIWSSSNRSSCWHRRQFLGTMPWLHRYRDNWWWVKVYMKKIVQIVLKVHSV